MIQSHHKTIYEALGRKPVHPFPARMAPGIALAAVAEFKKKPLRVLDPMMGSGTVLAVARSKGHLAFGVDIDPLSVLISKVWTTAVDAERVREKAVEVLDRARTNFTTLSVRDAYPLHADLETRRFVGYWFDDYARRQLAALSTAIHRVRDSVVRNVLWCGFSRLIIAKQSGASLAKDLPHSRPHRSFDRAPVKPFRKFLLALERVIENCIERKAADRGPAPRIYEGDARNLPLSDASIDLVLTSPPYLNAIDYMRCSKFSLVWLGYTIAELRHLRSNSVGTEAGKGAARSGADAWDIIAKLSLRSKLEGREEAVLARYIHDIGRIIREVARVLVPGGKAVFVIGENTIGGIYIRNSVIVSALAKLSGLRLQERYVRRLPGNRRYLPPPSDQNTPATLDARLRREVVLSFARPTA